MIKQDIKRNEDLADRAWAKVASLDSLTSPYIVTDKPTINFNISTNKIIGEQVD